MAKKQTIRIKYVYWKNGAWRYQAQGKLEREILGKSWVRLGTTEEEKSLNYWTLVGSKLGTQGGMEMLWERYRSEVLPRKAVRTARDDERMWDLMKPMFANGIHPSQITRQWGIEYIIARGIKGVNGFKPAPSRAMKEYALLRHMMNWAVDWGIIDRNPLLGVRVSEYLKIKVRDRVPEVWELLAVKKHADVSVGLFIDFKYMTGLDQSSCFNLLIPSFDGPGIPIKRSKTNKRGYIAWSEELEQVCRELIAFNNERCRYLFCNQHGGKVQVDSFAQRFKRAVRTAIEAGDLVEAFTPNDIRSSHGTDAEEIYGLDATKQLLNSEAARKHYVHKRKGEKITTLPRPTAEEHDENTAASKNEVKRPSPKLG